MRELQIRRLFEPSPKDTNALRHSPANEDLSTDLADSTNFLTLNSQLITRNYFHKEIPNYVI